MNKRHVIFGLLVVICYINTFAQNDQPISTAELIINSTIRIECIKDTVINGASYSFTSVGTGFFYTFKFDNQSVNCIVTNFHVIKGTKLGIFRFTEGVNGRPMYGRIIEVTVGDFGKGWLRHPSEDLAIFPIQHVIDEVNKRQKRNPFVVYFDDNILPSTILLDEMTAIEDVLMVGYPRGIRDSTNNLPIVRKGLTATPINIDYNGKPHFLLDIPVYPGSSGSPVVLYNQGSYAKKDGSLNVGQRIALLGINVQSINYDADGHVVVGSGNPMIPTVTNLPFNVAVIIKSSELLKFKPLILQQLKK